LLISRKIYGCERIYLLNRNNRRSTNSLLSHTQDIWYIYGGNSRLQGERWAIPRSLRRPLVERMGEIVRDPEAPHRDVLSAVSAILTASKINLANIALTMKVQTHEELEERVKELEGKVALGKGQTGWASSVRDEMKLCMSCRLSHVTSDKQ
jgi:hypothetical protein